MKSAMSEEEFGKVVVEFDRYLREGGEFDRKVVEFEHWRRARGIEAVGAGLATRRFGDATLARRWSGGSRPGKGEIGRGTLDDVVSRRRARCYAIVGPGRKVDFRNTLEM